MGLNEDGQLGHSIEAQFVPVGTLANCPTCDPARQLPA